MQRIHNIGRNRENYNLKIHAGDLCQSLLKKARAPTEKAPELKGKNPGSAGKRNSNSQK